MIAQAQTEVQAIASGPLEYAVARCDAWLDTMRGPGGYGGPVAHWWQQSLLYTGPGLDWRYEGIIAGYLALWQRSRDQRWLAKAQCAGDDLIAGQQSNGHFSASAFEINPAAAGTPHEAACDIGLLLLARTLAASGALDWQRYASCAERNLRSFYIGKLWDEQMQALRDSPNAAFFVPNKAATACEAFFLLAELQGDDAWVIRYVLPTLRQIVAFQVRGGVLDGAIAQNSIGTRRIEKYFPIYMARCIPALLQGYRWLGEEQFLETALRIFNFIVRWTPPDGMLPTVIYPNQRAIRHPCWIAALADVLRALDEMRPLGLGADLSVLHNRLLAGQDASGGFQTATGFAAQAGAQCPSLPDVRDLLHVVGWCDKAFRYLSNKVGSTLPELQSETFSAECVLHKQRFLMTETKELLEITQRSEVRYRWRKGQPRPEIAFPEFWLR